MPEDVLELDLTGMGYGGEALGRDEQGRMTFVPFAMPGERVKVQIVERHKRWARARLLQVMEPSPHRIEPRCLHYGVCGGRHYQHLPYDEQLAAKRRIVGDQLERIGGFDNPPIREMIPSPEPWAYRNHLRFSLTPDTELGFVDASGARVFRVQECHLPEAPIAQLWPQLELDAVSDLNAVGVRMGSEPDDRMVIFHGHGRPEMELQIDVPASAVWLAPEGQLVLAGGDSMTFQVRDRLFRVSPGAFFQVNSSLLPELVALVMEPLQPQSGEIIFDLYAGVGLFSAFAAQAGASVVAVEVSPWAAADYEVNLRDFEGVSLYEASVELALPEISASPNGVIVDPPRSGLSRDVLDQLVEIRPPSLVYVSCDPATLARDAKRLARAGFQLLHLAPIDLFPQTFHIETVSFWRS
jgi:23S rRNA (uracil1939-C5)-methyltransferase